jgi:RNA polymerase sigma-70 factor (ECF subfamily)
MATRRSGPEDLDLEGVRRRDAGALAALFERYFDRLYGIVFRLVGNRSAAEDAIQDVFLRVHRAAHQLDPARDPGPWLMTIATNVCRDQWRSSGQRLARASSSIEGNPGLAETLTHGAKNPELEAQTSERTRLVQEAILRLKEPLREVIVLREYEDLGYDQIAAITGGNETTVRKRYSRALAELGKQLREMEL